MSKFNIGDSVRVAKTNECGLVTDRMYSEANGHFIYVIKPDDGGRSFARKEDELCALEEKPEYEVKTEIVDNVVIGIIYEIRNGNKVEVCRGHGHIIHEGAEGIAQACSYAMRKAFEHVDSGIFFKKNRPTGGATV
jgi:hypothetical protein